MMNRHINIPIFIPHEGCPNDCVFCNQRSITASNEKADRDIRPEIEAALATIPDGCDVEIAFFGGSFTGIDRGVMERLLSDAYEYIKAGKVESIRLSTRPDFIDEEILGILDKYGVRHIELGIQSMRETVLLASKRGHTPHQTEQACRLITEHGFSLTGQMMIGLPSSTPEDEIYTAKRICEMGADSARIYPCVVFYDTALCEMARAGTYFPLTNEDAAKRSGDCIGVFVEAGVRLLRVGLQSGEGLSEDKVYGGASHDAIGEMSWSEYYFGKIKEAVEKLGLPPKGTSFDLIITCAKGEVSKAAGQKRANKEKLLEKYRASGGSLHKIKIMENPSLETGEISIELKLSKARK